jgi:hypothetical protein
MTDQESGRSAQACPECGAHQLTLLEFPSMDVRGVRPYDELIGMGDPRPDDPPGIGCLACGAEWPDLAAFRQATNEG